MNKADILVEKSIASTSSGSWDDFWHKQQVVLSSGLSADWYTCVWQHSLRYWARVFERAPGPCMLECGAGSAKVSMYMAERGYSCTMLDNSSHGLNLGRDAFERARLPGIFVLGDVTDMPFPSNRYDIVTSGGLLEHFHDVEGPLKEMVRVLRPGGILGAVIIPKKFSCQTLGDIQAFWVRLVLRILTLRLRGAITQSRRNFPFYENSIPLHHYRKVLEHLGIEGVVATGTSPFPSIALPKRLRPAYARLMSLATPLWDRFDCSTSKFTEIWGASYTIHGVKRA